MQNKANFQKVKFNVTKVITRNYDQLDTWSIRKTKPIQSQLKPIQSQSKPIQSQLKPIQSQLKPIAGSNPTCRGVASGEDGNKPNFKTTPRPQQKKVRVKASGIDMPTGLCVYLFHQRRTRNDLQVRIQIEEIDESKDLYHN
jgi:hypothetical protein